MLRLVQIIIIHFINTTTLLLKKIVCKKTNIWKIKKILHNSLYNISKDMKMNNQEKVHSNYIIDSFFL